MNTFLAMRTYAAFLAVIGLLLVSCGDTTEPATSTAAEPTSTTQTTSAGQATTTTQPPTTATTAGELVQTVQVFFSVDGGDCSDVEAFERTGSTEADPITLALEQLLVGPTPAEESAGAGSFFSSATADAVRAVGISDGLLNVDFTDIRFLNNASTSCGSQALISSLRETAFQFGEVERIRFTIWESCSLFWNWLQTECSEVARDGVEPSPIDVDAMASGSGCTPGDGPLPDGHLVWVRRRGHRQPGRVRSGVLVQRSGRNRGGDRGQRRVTTTQRLSHQKHLDSHAHRGGI